MKKQILTFCLLFLTFYSTQSFSQCANTGTLVAGDLTPPSVGLSTSQTYNAGEYVRAFVSAGANYTVSTCGSSGYDTQLTVYDDGTGAFYAYNDDFCGLQSSTSFTPSKCGYVRVLLHQYSCNASGLAATVTMTMNTAPTPPPVLADAPDASTCSGVPVSIGLSNPATGGTPPYSYAWTAAAGLSGATVTPTTATITSTATYTLTVTDANNCTSLMDNVTVTINPPPVVALGSDQSICIGATTTLDAGNAGSTYLWSDASSAQTLVASTSGSYNVTVTTPAGCIGYDTIAVTVNPLPVVSLGLDSIQCGGTILLDAGNAGSTYSWSDASAGQTLIASSTGTYYVAVTDVNGCIDSDTVNISIDPLPIVDLGVDTAQCGGTIMLDAGNAGSTYAWSDSSLTQTLTAASTGIYYVTVTNTSGCSSTDSVAVAINSFPVVTLGLDSAQCAGTILLDAGNVGSTFVWSDSSTTQTLVAGATGTYSVAVTDTLGCTSSDTINVTINTFPTVNLGSDSAQCGGTILLDAGNIGSTFVWSDSSTSQTFSSAATGTYYVNVTNPSGCTSSDSVNITINSFPNVNLGSDTIQCGGSVTVDAGNAGMNYAWSNLATTQTITLFTTDTVDVTVTNPTTGCMTSDTIIVTFGQYPVVNLGADTTQCAGIVTLDAANAGASFVWSTSATTQTISAGSSGTFVVTVTSGGCSTSDTITVTINPLPTVGFAPFTTAECIQSAALVLTGGSPAGGVYAGTGVSGTTFTPATAGVGVHSIMYTVTNVSTGCSNSSNQNITIQDCTGIEEHAGLNGISIYPNPANGMFTISFTDVNFTELTITIMNVEGQQVYSLYEKDIAKEYSKQISLENLAKGIYFIRMNTGNELRTEKLIIQ